MIAVEVIERIEQVKLTQSLKVSLRDAVYFIGGFAERYAELVSEPSASALGEAFFCLNPLISVMIPESIT